MATIPVQLGSARSASRAAPRQPGPFWIGIYLALLVGSGLEAYSLVGIPMPWIGNLMVLGGAALVRFTHFRSRPLAEIPGILTLICLLLWASCVTLLVNAEFDYSTLMPAFATSSYKAFVGLRYFVVLSFMAALLFAHTLLLNGGYRQLLAWLTNVGFLLGAAAIYIYFAQVFGWWEPPRNRMGTSAAQQNLEFTYAFHRALGTFREPSHLAEWIVVPLFASLARFRTPFNLQTFVMATALLMTGSMTGLMGAVCGLLGAVAMNPFGRRAWKAVCGSVIAVLLGLVAFYQGVHENAGGHGNIISVVTERLGEIGSGGMQASNRGYVYEYVRSQPTPMIGQGLGNSVLMFTDYLGVAFIASFLSLYFNILFSLGIPGLILIMALLAMPLIRLLRLRHVERGVATSAMLAAYLAWLVMFSVHAEELTPMFAVAYILLDYCISCDVMQGQNRLRQTARLQPAGLRAGPRRLPATLGPAVGRTVLSREPEARLP